MKSFAYVNAQTPESAVDLVRDQGRFLAGGIDLLGQMKESLTEPKALVNIKGLPGTRDITPGSDKWTIGANVTLTTLAEHPELRKVFPGIAEAAAEVGSPQMRNVATLGGNLAQHSRCWYYRHRDVRCLKKGGSRCFARQGGQTKYHSLFSSGPCLSPVVSNLAIALSALNATAIVQRGKKPEKVSLADLYVEAWQNSRVHNSLKPTDLILRVEVPVAANQRSAYLQSTEKGDFDWALVSCSAAAAVQGRTLRGVRIVLGVVAPKPWEVAEANALLEGKELTDELAGKVADRIVKDAETTEHNGYKVAIAHALIRRALKKLVA
jgi:xanthine dehydrogenase YagS FAD-binding subunit